jgi:hypothetical protein
MSNLTTLWLHKLTFVLSGFSKADQDQYRFFRNKNAQHLKANKASFRAGFSSAESLPRKQFKLCAQSNCPILSDDGNPQREQASVMWTNH